MVVELESLKKQINKGHGGKRKGAGMPPGKVTKKVAERKQVLKAYRKKVEGIADKLFITQANLALGSQLVFIRQSDEDAMGKEKPKMTLVTDPKIIESILNDPDMKHGDEYAVVTTVAPDPKVISDMLDRAFGRPTQVVDPNGDDGEGFNINITKKIINE